MSKKWIHIVTAITLSMGFVCSATAQTTETTQSEAELDTDEKRPVPFSNYTKLIDMDGIVVYGNSASLFTPYTGPKLPPEEIEETERTRHGVLQLSTSLQVYLDYITNPMGGSYELINVENNKIVGQFDDPFSNVEALYINGTGNVYVYSVPAGLCWGRTTYKYELSDSVLTQTPQPLYYMDAKSLTAAPLTNLLLEPKDGAPKVASLANQTHVNVVGIKPDLTSDGTQTWFLIRTPLGLTGWAKSYHDGESFFDIIQCN